MTKTSLDFAVEGYQVTGPTRRTPDTIVQDTGAQSVQTVLLPRGGRGRGEGGFSLVFVLARPQAPDSQSCIVLFRVTMES